MLLLCDCQGILQPLDLPGQGFSGGPTGGCSRSATLPTVPVTCSRSARTLGSCATSLASCTILIVHRGCSTATARWKCSGSNCAGSEQSGGSGGNERATPRGCPRLTRWSGTALAPPSLGSWVCGADNPRLPLRPPRRAGLASDLDAAFWRQRSGAGLAAIPAAAAAEFDGRGVVLRLGLGDDALDGSEGCLILVSCRHPRMMPGPPCPVKHGSKVDHYPTFETFPFPGGLTPDVPAASYAAEPRAVAVAEAARRLVELRDRWLNPPEWADWVDEPAPEYPRRPVPRDWSAMAWARNRPLGPRLSRSTGCDPAQSLGRGMVVDPEQPSDPSDRNASLAELKSLRCYRLIDRRH